MITSHESLVYSYSKLRAFETCPLKFRYRYLERIRTDLESIEAFTGKRVHEVLEALYRSLARDRRPPEVGEILALYDQAWKRAWHPGVVVAKEAYTPTDYHHLGGRCLTTFYRGNWPFTGDRTLGLETKVEFGLGDGNGPRMAGVLDRLAAGPGGELVIHDYKTSTYLPRKDEILGDLQLAIYQLGAAERWPGREAKLVWHFLAFGRRVTVRLGRSGVDGKRAELGKRIAVIAAAIEAERFPARVSRLCDWCSYRRLCPVYQESSFSMSRPMHATPPLPVKPRTAGAPLEPRIPPRPSLRLPPLRSRTPRRGRRVPAESLAQLRLL